MKQYNLIFKDKFGKSFDYLVFDIENLAKYVKYFTKKKKCTLIDIEEGN